MKNMWVVEYSRLNKWFRVDRLEGVITKNIQLLLRKVYSDFVIMYVGEQLDCWNFCDALEKRFRGSDGRYPEMDPGERGKSEVDRLRKRVVELEKQLEEIIHVEIKDLV
jgi:hypothetical protein